MIERSVLVSGAGGQYQASMDPKLKLDVVVFSRACHAHTCMHACMHVRMHARMHAHTLTIRSIASALASPLLPRSTCRITRDPVNAGTCMCTCMCVCTFRACACGYVCVYECACVFACARVHVACANVGSSCILCGCMIVHDYVPKCHPPVRSPHSHVLH